MHGDPGGLLHRIVQRADTLLLHGFTGDHADRLRSVLYAGGPFEPTVSMLPFRLPEPSVAVASVLPFTPTAPVICSAVPSTCTAPSTSAPSDEGVALL